MLILSEVQYLQSQELLSYIIPVSEFVKIYLIRVVWLLCSIVTVYTGSFYLHWVATYIMLNISTPECVGERWQCCCSLSASVKSTES